MNLNQQIDYMQAAANPFPLKASFRELEGGGYQCKMCGAKCPDQGKATDHLLEKHREMESGGPGSGRRPEGLGGKKWSVGNYIKNRDKTTWDQKVENLRKSPLVSDETRKKLEARDFSEGRRKKLAKSGDAMPGGGFPIVNESDLANAKRAIGRAKNPAAARAHINERAKALGAKPIGQEMEGQTEFSPANRLQMPKKAGQNTTTQNPQYTGGFPQLQAEKKAGCCEACNERAKMEALGLKMRRPSMGHSSGCGGHTGFHKGAGYENKAAKMGHRLTLSAGVERGVLIRQRAGMRRKTGYSFRGYQSL